MSFDIPFLTAKMKRFLELEEHEALVGTIKFGRTRIDTEKKVAGGRFARSPNFMIPCPRPERPVSSDGRVTFHFSHSFVVKQAPGPTKGKSKSTALTLAGDGEGYSTDAADHERYITREGAVMPITAGAYDQYIHAGNIDASGGAIFTNIHRLVGERAKFWDAVTRRERTPSPDIATVYSGRLTATQWAELLSSPDCPTKLKAGLDAGLSMRSHTGIAIELTFRDFTIVQKRLKKLGLWSKDHPPLTIKRGRGGRIQRRLVAEFPLGLNDVARLRITQRFADHLAEKGMMYTAVVHAPDHHNNERNYHLHIAAYDRPCRYLEEHGCWDFDYAVPVKGQHKRETFPFRQPKIGELTRSSSGGSRREHGKLIFNELRETFANFCNDELRDIGINRLFDHRSFAAMNIKQAPSRHLGTRAAALEAVGVPTNIGTENAEKSWQGEFDRLVDAHEIRRRVRSDCSTHAAERLAFLQSTEPSSILNTELKTLKGRLDDLIAEIGDKERDVLFMHLTLQMAYSRADNTAEVCQRLLDAIAQGTATKADQDAEDKIRARLRLAEAHSDRIDAATHADVQAAIQLAETLNFQAEQIEKIMATICELIDRVDSAMLGRRSEIGPEPAQLQQHVAAERCSPPSRKSREIEAYFRAPLDYQDEWDNIFHRIVFGDIVVEPPSKEVPAYHVPGISKADLDKLLNPIFQARSQGRLKAIYEGRQRALRRESSRAAERADRDQSPVFPEALGSNSVAKEVDEAITMDRGSHAPSTQHPDAPSVDYAALKRKALEKLERDRAEAMATWIEDYRKHHRGCLPVKFDGCDVVLDVSLLPKSLQAMAIAFEDKVTTFLVNELGAIRTEIAELLEVVPDFVESHSTGVVARPNVFPDKLRPHLRLLFDSDPVTQNAVNRALAAQASASVSTIATPQLPPPALLGEEAIQIRNAPLLPASGIVDSSPCHIAQTWHETKKGNGVNR